jgi:hypothetical protein
MEATESAAKIPVPQDGPLKDSRPYRIHRSERAVKVHCVVCALEGEDFLQQKLTAARQKKIAAARRIRRQGFRN